MNEGKIEIGVNQGAVAQGANAVAVCVRETTDFRPGDTVELKSGSPLMTVTEVTGNQIRCTWFRGKENNQGMFPAVTLLPKAPAWRQPENLTQRFGGR